MGAMRWEEDQSLPRTAARSPCPPPICAPRDWRLSSDARGKQKQRQQPRRRESPRGCCVRRSCLLLESQDINFFGESDSHISDQCCPSVSIRAWLVHISHVKNPDFSASQSPSDSVTPSLECFFIEYWTSASLPYHRGHRAR